MLQEEWMMQEKQCRCLLRTAYEEALHYAEMLHSDNTDRKEADSNITEEALALIEENDPMAKKKIHRAVSTTLA